MHRGAEAEVAAQRPPPRQRARRSPAAASDGAVAPAPGRGPRAREGERRARARRAPGPQRGTTGRGPRAASRQDGRQGDRRRGASAGPGLGRRPRRARRRARARPRGSRARGRSERRARRRAAPAAAPGRTPAAGRDHRRGEAGRRGGRGRRPRRPPAARPLGAATRRRRPAAGRPPSLELRRGGPRSRVPAPPGRAQLRLGVEAGVDHLDERARQVAARRPASGSGAPIARAVAAGVARDRVLAAPALVQGQGERVDVGLGPGAQRPRPARAPCRRACRPPRRLRSAPAPSSTRAIPKSISFAVPARAVADEDVLRLDVAVDDAAGVRVVERLAEVGADLADVAVAERPVAAELRAACRPSTSSLTRKALPCSSPSS